MKDEHVYSRAYIEDWTARAGSAKRTLICLLLPLHRSLSSLYSLIWRTSQYNRQDRGRRVSAIITHVSKNVHLLPNINNLSLAQFNILQTEFLHAIHVHYTIWYKNYSLSFTISPIKTGLKKFFKFLFTKKNLLFSSDLRERVS